MSVIGTVSSDSTSTGHRKRNPRAELRNARALPSGESLSARETASEGAGRSQLTESGKHYLTATVHRNLRSQSEIMAKLPFLVRFLIWPAAPHHLAHTWRTPGAHLAHPLTQASRTPAALLSHSCLIPWRTPGSAGADPPLARSTTAPRSNSPEGGPHQKHRGGAARGAK